MSHRSRKRRDVVTYTLADSELGRMILAATSDGVCFLSIGDDDATLEEDLRSTVPAREYRYAAGAVLPIGPYVAQVLRYLQGDEKRLSLPVDARGTPFQEEVWSALAQIPYGETTSYTDISEQIGRPQSVRSVAQACGANPVPLVIPCHRVLQKDGGLGGFGLGVERKQHLLELEQRQGQRIAN